MNQPYVIASRDFTYTTELIVKRGQVFQLGDHKNDPLLLKHRHVSLLDPQPKASAVRAMPTCGECGRIFVEEFLRDQCGMSHEEGGDEFLTARRVAATDRAEAAKDKDRIFTVGA